MAGYDRGWIGERLHPDRTEAGIASRLKITSRRAGAIRHAGTTVRPVCPRAIAKALGADEVVYRENVHGAPISRLKLRDPSAIRHAKPTQGR